MSSVKNFILKIKNYKNLISIHPMNNGFSSLNDCNIHNNDKNMNNFVNKFKHFYDTHSIFN